jgi:hypothetical protein
MGVQDLRKKHDSTWKKSESSLARFLLGFVSIMMESGLLLKKVSLHLILSSFSSKTSLTSSDDSA